MNSTGLKIFFPKHSRYLSRWFSSSAVRMRNFDALNKCQLEFTSGAGGTEAMIFTKDLFEMYQNFAQRNQWKWQPIEVDNVQMGIRSAIVCIHGPTCYAKLRFEGGVHRVQRIPLTDKSRFHTSTASVTVLPEPEDPEFAFSRKDVKVEATRASGPGGMNVNARSTAIRVTHIPTGTTVKAMDERHQRDNMELAFARLAAILLQKEVDEASRKLSNTRKLQIGSLARAEKIRTYNFKDNRVTDHRLKHTCQGVEDFLAGGSDSGLEEMLELLGKMYAEEQRRAEEEEKEREQGEEKSTDQKRKGKSR